MIDEIYDPLKEYKEVFKDRFNEIAEKTFAQIAEESKVDVDSNRRTCKALYLEKEKLKNIKSKRSAFIFLACVLWVCVAVAIFIVATKYDILPASTIILLSVPSIIIAFLQITIVHPRINALKKARTQAEVTLQNYLNTAWKQMESLNNLYDWDVLTRMAAKTVPKLEFDPYFTTQRLNDLITTYGWDESFNRERSVLYSISGLIRGNPFVICRTRKMIMGDKTYTGTKTIYWTETEYDSNGKARRVTKSQTLVAYVTAPCPIYYEKARLIYGNTAAPDLIFYRKQNDLAGKEKSLSFKWKRYKLRRKARDLDNADYAMMTNEDFEVAFNASNRNSNQQFALLFTPIAQEAMMNLLKDNSVGYGDDFDFDKNKKINIILPDHLQSIDLDMNPDKYHHFDYDKAQELFRKTNAEYFRSIYFALAPLLCIPMYQQIRPQSDIYGHDMKKQSSFWEHEALANFWGQDKFKHPQCATNCILKTEKQTTDNENAKIKVYAYGHRIEKRISYIKKYGNDGRYHDVPVEWDEYLPVTGSGQFFIKEDNTTQEDNISHKERISHINEILQKTNLDIYRRHIASKI